VRELPSGKVTFLFSDIEGSTKLLDDLGSVRYAEALADHRRMMRDAFATHGGVEVDTQGDAFFVAFSDARGAVAAAGQAQHELSGGPIAVRMGLHTGEPLLTGEGYVGIDIHRGARVMSAGHGGQVLLSDATYQLLGGDDRLIDLGLHRLKDLTEPQRLWQLGDGEFPPLKTLYQTNLPVQPTPLVGRQAELAAVLGLLAESRLVTLTGAGGSGKTRLALQAAAELVDDYRDGVWWIPLAALADPELVMRSIGQVVGARNGLVEHLRSRETLLLLDNFEQLLDAAPALAELLSETTEVKVLATSREPLKLGGEQRFPVEPLADSDAVTLFLERARAVEPSFQPSPAIEAICRRLDGLPLALELAAARLSLLSAEELLVRLESALPLLTGGVRDAPERQRTLRATIEWSNDLCSAEEQLLFGRLAVFSGSFTLEAAERVCAATVDSLQSLVDKSLVRRWASGRFGMLETIHEFARGRFDEAGEAQAIERAHAEHFLAVAESANLSVDADGPPNHELARLEQANFRAALEWAVTSSERELGLRIAVALAQYWVSESPFEGDHWFERLLADAEDVDPGLLAAALRDQGGAVYIVGQFGRGLALYERSLALYRELGDDLGTARVVQRLAVDAARLGDHARARELTEEARATARRLGDRQGEAQALTTLGGIARDEGDIDQAVELLVGGAEAAGDAGFPWWEGATLLDLGDLAVGSGRLDDAEGWIRDGLAVLRGLGDRQLLVYGLALLARVAGERGQPERSGLLWGAVEAEEQRGAIGQWENERPEYEQPVLAHVGPEFDRGRSTGRELSLDEAVQFALTERELPTS
jgi:predicted ATPase/class 3 adenylate cyclase